MINETIKIPDQTIRDKIFDLNTSFIVQAPAGSGKTTLLVSRYLALLAEASDVPENILALTFTNKAANEMRHRIIQALNYPEKLPKQQQTYVQKILERDKKNQWHLIQNPYRLRIQTIDSFCRNLIDQLPITTKLGSTPKTCNDPTPYYEKAAQKLLENLDDPSTEKTVSAALKKILNQLDNNFSETQKLLSNLLKDRAQWLPILMAEKNRDPESLRNDLESHLNRLMNAELQSISDSFSDGEKQKIVSLLNYAAYQLRQESEENIEILGGLDLTAFPENNFKLKKQWKAITSLLLTKEGAWRNTVNKNLGFPSENSFKNSQEKRLAKDKKNEALQLLAALKKRDADSTLRNQLSFLQKFSSIRYEQEQCELISALFKLLPLLVAHLHILFSENDCLDFTEISLRADQALGHFEDPSDLALKLDYKIQHILIDEFQDTSIQQFRLLKKLTQGWQENERRTLFLVGDPMQSIYGFRHAEVGLFLEVRENGIENIRLTPLQLTTNFRSQEKLIEFINETFCSIFSKGDNFLEMDTADKPRHVGDTREEDCIAYTPSVAVKPAISETPPVSAYLCLDKIEEANAIITKVKNLQEKFPGEKIAILARDRNCFSTIIQSLKKSHIAFQATELFKLSDIPIIQDLWILTKALLHFYDRIAWLALLRTPWCGLRLPDLLALSETSNTSTLWEILLSSQQCEKLSKDAQNRIKYFLPILKENLALKGIIPVSLWIEKVWRELGGEKILEPPYREEVQNFFELLEKHTAENISPDLQSFENILEKTHTTSSGEQNVIELMTIHKAKGLEFDHVIVPGLNRGKKRRDKELFQWYEIPSLKKPTFLFAANEKTPDKNSQISDFISYKKIQKNAHEEKRLLYVALTRAKKSLHLFAALKQHEGKNGNKITSGEKTKTFYDLLTATKILFTPAAHQATEASFSSNGEKTVAPTLKTSPPLRRLILSPEKIKEINTHSDHANSKKISRWEIRWQRILGIVLHRLLKNLTLQDIKNFGEASFRKEKLLWKNLLLRESLPLSNLNEALELIKKSLIYLNEDKRAHWIFDDQHQDLKTEFDITAFVEGQYRNYIIDRTFIDSEGIRWIIDFKTAQPEAHESHNVFLEKQFLLYEAQLKNYAKLMQDLDKRKIRLGLYFPLFKGWYACTYSE